MAETKKIPGNAEPLGSDGKSDEESEVIRNEQYQQTDIAHRKAIIQNLQEQNKDLRLDRRLRWRYARWVFRYLVIYSLFVAALLVAAGFRLFGFNLPESVLGFLVGSTAASAIGLVLAVTVGLFQKK